MVDEYLLWGEGGFFFGVLGEDLKLGAENVGEIWEGNGEFRLDMIKIY